MREWIETIAHVATVVAVFLAWSEVKQAREQAEKSELAISQASEQLKLSRDATVLSVNSALRQSAIATKTVMNSEPLRRLWELTPLSCSNSPIATDAIKLRAENGVFEVMRHYDFLFRANELDFLKDEDWQIACKQLGTTARNCVVEQIWENEIKPVSTKGFVDVVEECKER